MPAAPVAEILERSASYFETVLWESDAGARMRLRLERAGISESTLREFRVGYAPGDTRELLSHLGESGHAEDEIAASGIARASGRERLHVLFHARIVFPIDNREGDVVGFAGLGTHLGPSWPLWVTSPDQGPFEAGSAFFGMNQAADGIERAGRALVLRDCVQVLGLYEEGRRDAVGVIQSPITRFHMTALAAAIGIDSRELHLARRDGREGVVATRAGAPVEADAFALRTLPAGFTLIDAAEDREPATPSGGTFASAPDYEPPRARPIVYIAGTLIGVGLPLGLLLVAEPHNEAAEGSTPTLNIVIGGLAVAYLALTVIVARISARTRERSTTRRMREPWARGSGEWQPRGWTYHRLEEILVGAALASAITCVVLMLTVGGFLG